MKTWGKHSWAQGQVTWVKMAKNLFHFMTSADKKKEPQKFVFIAN